MAWSWQFEDAAGDVVAPEGVACPEFSHQGDAESWLGESWRDLLESGVQQVTLFEDGRKVYGPMSLRPAG